MTGSSFQRYAIYWMPEPGTHLAAFGKLWLANASANGGSETYGLTRELAARATKSPAHYQLHATMKAPFRLRESAAHQDVQYALDAFCAARRSPVGGPLRLVTFQKYLALTPACPVAELDWLAAECVVHFDRFRATLNDGDRARRSPSMTARQAAFFEEFGYPYVLSEFKFHVTLAGPLEDAELREIQAAIAPQLDAATVRPLRIESLCLLGEPWDGSPFVLLSRHHFMGCSALV